MTTSGVYGFSVNRDQIIRMAMMILSKLEESEIPSDAEISDGAMMLNMLVKQWQGKADFAPGLKTWTRRHGHLFLSNATGAYTLGPDAIGWTDSYTQYSAAALAAAGQNQVTVTAAGALTNGANFGLRLDSNALFWSKVQSVVGNLVTLTDNLPSQSSSDNVAFAYTVTGQQPVIVETCFLRDLYNQDIPMRRMTLQDYDYLPSKTDVTAISDPAAFYYEFQLGDSNFYTDAPASQDTSKHLCITYMSAVQDFVNPTDTPYYPQEWYLALAYGLAKQLAPIYNATWTPVMQENAASALGIAQRKEPEITTMYFQPGEDGSL